MENLSKPKGVAGTPKIAVLLATYNGEKFLSEQLDSYADQTIPPSWIIASDDGSTDNTRAIFENQTKDLPNCLSLLLEGPKKGHKANFAFLLNQIPEDADLVAISDQDDVWLPKKLERAFTLLEEVPAQIPGLYGSRTVHTSVDLTQERLSPLLGIRPTFEHALAQNFAGGNTMVLNAASIDLIKRTNSRVGTSVHHDWWLYLLISGCGGRVIYDPEPTLLYRQHTANSIGANEGRTAAVRRSLDMLRGRYQKWNNSNLEALDGVSDFLSSDAKATLQMAKSIKVEAFLKRLWTLKCSGIHRATTFGQLGLWASVALKRF